MGFLSGGATYLRFRVLGTKPRHFGEDHLIRLHNHQAGTQRLASADGIECGWTAGDHVLDTDFQPVKSIINDALHFELRVDQDKLPSDLLKAYTSVELKALSANNPSGLPSARQKREAKESARDRLEAESKDGRFRKRKCIPLLWDCMTGELLYGATSNTHVDRMASLFDQTFGAKLEAVTAGRRAFVLSEPHNYGRGVDDAAASPFVPGVSPTELSWLPDETSRDFLGNEFLLWLWFHLEIESDTLTLSDGSEATLMLARSLTLECPRGATGLDTIRHEGPTSLPEAKRAAQSGKLPRKAGLTVVRHDQQYELNLAAETLAVGSAKLPNPPEEATSPRARAEERINQLRSLNETLDLVYEAFCLVRFGTEWKTLLPRLQKWLAREDRRG
jgi:hypothetical protein